METTSVIEVLAAQEGLSAAPLGAAHRALDAVCDLARVTLTPDELYEFTNRLLEWSNEFSS